MAYKVKFFSKTPLPGQGFNAAGAAKQGKTMVVGLITISSYTTGGEVVTPADIGLSAIDFLHAAPQSLNATEPANGAPLGAQYIYSTQKLMAFTDFDAGTETTSTHAGVIRFFATGDSAQDVELR